MVAFWVPLVGGSVTSCGESAVVTPIQAWYEPRRLCVFLGEEHGACGDQTPLDTRSDRAHIPLARDSPLCAITLALIHHDYSVMGLAALPFLHRIAATGCEVYQGSWTGTPDPRG